MVNELFQPVAEPRKLKVLELFAGTRSIGKAFEAHGHEVFSVEWDKKFEDIDLYADIFTTLFYQHGNFRGKCFFHCIL